jgi:hypothetical protein
MLKIFMTVAALAVSLPTLGQGVLRQSQEPEVPLIYGHRNSTLAAGTALGGYVLSSRPFLVTRVVTWVSVVSGGGAGDTVVRICIPATPASSCSGATQVCTATMTCASTQTVGIREVAVTGDCLFPAGAVIEMIVQTAGCTTTQPSVVNFSALGTWK